MKKLLLLINLVLMIACSDFINTKSKTDFNKKPEDRIEIPENLSNYLPGVNKNPSISSFSCVDKLDFKALKNTQTFNDDLVVDSLVENYYLNEFQLAYESLLDLDKLAEVSCKANSNMSDESWYLFQMQWQKAMNAFHRTEVLKMGPIAKEEEKNAYGMYSWPSTDKCGIDTYVLKHKTKEHLGLPYFEKHMGLDAMEYLLFSTAEKHSCWEGHERFDDLQNWTELETNVKRNDRCQYVQKINKKVQAEIYWLAKQWDRNNGNKISYYKEKGAKYFVQEMYNKFMPYMDKVIKDTKLGAPSGINRQQCLMDACPFEAEHISSKNGLVALSNNYHGLISILLGSSDHLHSQEAIGIYDLLAKNGFESFAQELVEELHKADCQLRKIKDKDVFDLAWDTNRDNRACKETDMENRKDPLCALYFDAKKLSDLFKNDFRLALSLRAPKQGAGDND